MLNILLVDDEREERDGIQFLIEKYNYPLNVSHAPNGRAALEYINNNCVDILFTDVKMPLMNGLELSRLVNESYPDIRIIIFSAYSEFDYAKQAMEANAVNYLLKPIEVEEFKEVMSSVIEAVADMKRHREEAERLSRENTKNFLYKIFTVGYLSDSELSTANKIIFGSGSSRLRLINIEFMSNFYEDNEEVFIRLVKMYLGESTKYIDLLQNEAYLIVQEAKYLNRDAIKEQITKLMRDIKMFIKDELSIIVGKTVDSVEEFLKELDNIKIIRQNFFGFGDSIVWTESDNVNEYYSTDLESIRKQLMLAIDTSRTELIEEYSRKLVSALIGNNMISKIYVQNMLYSIMRAIYEKNPGIAKEKLLKSADLLFQPKGYKLMLEDFQNSLRDILKIVDDEVGQCVDEIGVANKIKGIVDREYMKDISLNYVAKKVNLAPAYVSYIFKKQAGITLVKYITDVKMEKARILLEEDELKIVQIGRACGYENQSYFNRLFKNYFGVTPKQYKEKKN